jgi:hypothetical protein
MRLTAVVFTFAALLSSPLAYAGALSAVEVFDRTAGQTLTVYERQGRLYIAGEPGHQYDVRIRNKTGGRLLAVASVDGVNVVTGETAAEQQSGYVISATDTAVIDGWRKSLEEVATFYFTSLGDSYAARTGRPRNVGVIGVALFREREYCCVGERLEKRADQDAAAPSAPSEPSTAGAGTRRESQTRLGTGHGHREASAAQYVAFERRSKAPDETIVVYYDSRQNLVAQGVIPSRPALADRRPNPFPSGFVPDP